MANSRARSGAAWGIGCLVLFLLPFAAFGIGIVAVAILRLREGNTREALLAGGFAALFAAIGVGGIAMLLANRRTILERAALEDLHPDAPWLWRPDWASGRLVYPTGTLLGAIWAFTALWNVVAAPAGVMGVRIAQQEGKPAAWLILLFPLIGVGLLVHAVRASLRYRRFGVSRLDLSTVPGVVGRSLAGVLRVPVAMQPAEGFTAVLTCVRVVTSGSAAHASPSETVLWQEEQMVAGEWRADGGTAETRIPIAFDLPADAAPSDRRDWRSRVEWRLRVSASVPGVDYDARFDVPVFRTPESARTSAADEERRLDARMAGYHQPEGSRIVVSRTPGRTDIWLPAGRNPGAAIVITLLAMVFAAGVAVGVNLGWEWYFLLFQAVFTAILLFAALELWLRVTRVTVRPGTLTWASGYLTPGRERTLAAAQIAKVEATVGMTIGPTVYHDITVFRIGGRKVRLAGSIRHKPEAEWLVGFIRSRLAADPRPSEALV